MRLQGGLYTVLTWVAAENRVEINTQRSFISYIIYDTLMANDGSSQYEFLQNTGKTVGTLPSVTIRSCIS